MIKYSKSIDRESRNIYFDVDLLQEINVFRANNLKGSHMMNFSEAVRHLIRVALEK